MKVASFVVDSFADCIDMVIHCCHSIVAFFCSQVGEFVVVIEVYGTRMKAMQTSLTGKFVSSGGCGVISKFCKR